MEFSQKRVITLLLLLYFLGFFVRVQGFDEATSQRYPVYYSEGSSHYSFIKALVEKGFLPESDVRLQSPEGFFVFSRTPVLLYYLAAVCALVCSKLGVGLYGGLLLLPSLLYCTTVFTVYALSRSLSGSRAAALVSSALYALSMASISRSTLAHLLYENMALPLIFLHVLFLVKSFDALPPKRMFLYSGLSGLFLFTALGSWFASGFYLATLVLCFTLLYFTGLRWDMRAYSIFGVQVLFALAALWAFPYLPKDSIQLSLAYTLIASVLVSHYRRLGLFKAGVVYLVLLVFFVGQAHVSPDFSHVYSVFINKILYQNKWSSNMPYEVKMTWVSGYDSPSWNSIALFLTLLPVGLLALAYNLLRWRRTYQSPAVKILSLMALAYFLLFLLAVRLAVFTVFFMAVLYAFAVGWAENKFKSHLSRLHILLFFLVLVEAGLGYYLTVDAHYQTHPDVAGMLDYIKKNTAATDVVLSSYFESPMIEAYTGRPVLLNPFWESVQIRRKVEFFDRALFDGEAEYHNMLRTYGVGFIAYNRGVCDGTPRFVGLTPTDGSFIKSMCDGKSDKSLFEVDYTNPSYFLIKPIP